MLSGFLSKLTILVFGTLYPAYRSYKAIKNKDVRGYVRWMMYWTIYALFITIEMCTDIFLSWFPLYFEIKILFVLWLIAPATKGSSFLYRKFLHPRLVKHEVSIDKYIEDVKADSYATVMKIGRKGLSAAGDTILKTAVTGQFHLVETIKRYNSSQDLTDFGKTQTSESWQQDSDTNYDPDNDVDLLQKQYKSSRQADNYIPEDSEAESVASQLESIPDEDLEEGAVDELNSRQMRSGADKRRSNLKLRSARTVTREQRMERTKSSAF